MAIVFSTKTIDKRTGDNRGKTKTQCGQPYNEFTVAKIGFDVTRNGSQPNCGRGKKHRSKRHLDQHDLVSIQRNRHSFRHINSRVHVPYFSLYCPAVGAFIPFGRPGLLLWRRRRDSNPCPRFCKPVPEPLGYAALTCFEEKHSWVIVVQDCLSEEITRLKNGAVCRIRI